MLLCQLWSVPRCHASLILISSKLQLHVIWIPTKVFFILECKSPQLSLFLSHLFFKWCLGQYLSCSGCFWSCCPPCFPSVSLWSALRMTSPLVRSAVLCCAVLCDELGSFIYPRAQRAEQPCLNIRPCNSTKQHPFKPTCSAFSSIFNIMQKKYRSCMCVYIKGRVVLVWAV